MAQQIINVGAEPNDGLGDPLRTSFQKTNANFTELYNNELGQSCPGVYYVSPDGSDLNDGKTLASSFLTIGKASDTVTLYLTDNPESKATIYVKTGTYYENNPIIFPANSTLIGDNLRAVTVYPINPTQDIFQLNNACYVWGVTFKGHLDPAAAIAFPSTGAGFITHSPYVQNCTSATTTGCGMRINGNLADGLKSMVLDAYTQINQGGIGIHIMNEGYAQLVSLFTICCSYGVLVESGGTCSITNSNSSFGNYGLVASGAVAYPNSGLADSTQAGQIIYLKGLIQAPTTNQAISFDNGVTLNDIWQVSPLSNDGKCYIEVAAPYLVEIPDNSPCAFYVRSTITASAHSFEFVGTGTELASALPQAGGQPLPENQVLSLQGGQVIYTSTDQRGDFKVGDNLTINGSTGTITGDTFDKSLFAVLTPYILALEG